MNTVLIGHRGAGKSSLLKRIQSYRKGMESEEFHDLDDLIEQIVQKKISEIFSEVHEAGFRDCEKKTFEKLKKNTSKNTEKNMWIAVGAGFDLALLPKSERWRILWIKRDTDSPSKVFLNRPDLKDYEAVFAARTKAYEAYCGEQLMVPEGWDFENESERLFFQDKVLLTKGIYTLHPCDFNQSLPARLEGLVKRGYEKIELRDDLLQADEIRKVLALLNPGKALYSVRNPERFHQIKNLLSDVKCDWPVDLGAPPMWMRLYSLSLHSILPDEGMKAAIARFAGLARSVTDIKNQNPPVFLKFAPRVRNFAELECAHDWAFEDLSVRNFLPRSGCLAQDEGQNWRWYRSLSKDWYQMHFVNEGFSDVKDQPLLLDWIRLDNLAKDSLAQDKPVKTADPFGAVLGYPVLHSRTPAFHWKKDVPVLSVAVRPDAFSFSSVISFLTRLGLRFVAVTSPLKGVAAQYVKSRMTAVNTLRFNRSNSVWEGTNTDTPACVEVLGTEIKHANVLVFGGGGMLESIKNIFPQAIYLSARTLKERDGSCPLNESPKCVIWAVPRAAISAAYFDEEKTGIFKSWKVDLVFDLNYSDDSPGLEFAKITNASYKNGRALFEKQAGLQKSYWGGGKIESQYIRQSF